MNNDPVGFGAGQRRSKLHDLQAEVLDLLVIGGGIVGSGIARDAAMRGLKVGLVERHDFASGTSSRSSRLLHGGLRYLAQGRIGLVHEASVEKKIVHHIAPHLSAPLPFVFPCYKGSRDWVLWQLKIGVKIYDLLCGGRNLGQSTWLTPEQVHAAAPGLMGSGLLGGVRYYDGLTNDARLTLDTLQSAARHGARILNYCEFLDARREGDWKCQLRDISLGQPFVIHAKVIVNATGPWADGLPHSAVKLRITKGIHLVVDRSKVPVPDTVVMTEGKRILFAIPWGERTILGTTDTDYNGSLDSVITEPFEMDYVLRITNQFFPEARLTPKDVISSWAGLRPLVADPNGKPSDISRSHQITHPEPGWWDVAGGKLTTYRLMGEQTVDRVLKELRQAGQLPGTVRECLTAEEPLLSPGTEAKYSGLVPPEVSRPAVEHYVTREWALHLDDIMLRRAGWHYYHQSAPMIALRVADWMGELLAWTVEEHSEELDRYARAAGVPRPTDKDSTRRTGVPAN